MVKRNEQVIKTWQHDRPVDILKYISSHSVQFNSVAQLCPTLWNPMHARPPGPSPTHRVDLNSSLLSRWCHPAILSSVVPFSSCPQSFPASGSFQLNALHQVAKILEFQLQHQSMNIQDQFPLGWTGWISLLSKGLSRVFSNTTVQKHQFFSAKLSLQSNCCIHTWLLEKP